MEEEALGKAYDGRLLARLWPYVAPYRAQVLLTLAIVVPLFALELTPAWIIKNGLDVVTHVPEIQRASDHSVDRGPVMFLELGEDGFLVGEVLVERADGHPGPLGDAVGGGPVPAHVVDDLGRRLEDGGHSE